MDFAVPFTSSRVRLITTLLVVTGLKYELLSWCAKVFIPNVFISYLFKVTLFTTQKRVGGLAAILKVMNCSDRVLVLALFWYSLTLKSALVQERIICFKLIHQEPLRNILIRFVYVGCWQLLLMSKMTWCSECSEGQPEHADHFQ